MAVLKNGSKCSHTTCMLRFFTVFRLALNPNLYFEIGSGIHPQTASFGPERRFRSFEILDIALLCLLSQ